MNEKLQQLCREKLSTVPDPQLVAFVTIVSAKDMLDEKAILTALRGTFASSSFAEQDLEAMRKDMVEGLAALTLAANRFTSLLDEIKEAAGTSE